MQGRITLWSLRLIIIALLAACSFLGHVYDKMDLQLSDCLDNRARCIGRSFEANRWLRVVSRHGSTWKLSVDEAAFFYTQSTLGDIRPNDYIEATLTVTSPNVVVIQSHEIIHTRLLTLRVVMSIVASIIVLLLLALRWHKRYKNRNASSGPHHA